jgi:HSP20 family protein
MTLIKWNNPSKGLDKRSQFTPSLENFFNDFFNNDLTSREYAGYVPSVNITENEKSYNIGVSAPGFDKNDFHVQVEDGVLTIAGEHKAEKTDESTNFVRKEFNMGSFSRSFNLVDLVDEEKIDAKYENGIVKIELPKSGKAKAKNVKQIKIS